MIIRSLDDYFLIKVFKSKLGDFNIFDLDSIKGLFQIIVKKLNKKYDLHGLIDVNVYINDNYGLVIEVLPIDSYFDEIDMRINVHFSDYFFVEIDSNSILNYDDVYYYNGNFYGSYKEFSDSDIIYKDTDEITVKGIKIS